MIYHIGYRKRRAFTLIEMLIVIAVIAILALVVIPRLLAAGRKAKEGTLQGDLQQLRKAIEQFQADCGDYPSAINQLMIQPSTGTTGGTGVVLDTNDWQGPYLRTSDGNLPVDPFTNSSTTWSYTATTGHIQTGTTLSSLNGIAYNTW